MKEKTKNPFMRFGAWTADVFKWLFDMKDWKLLLRGVPGLVTAFFVVATVVMNLAAAKTIVMTDPSWLGMTGGVLISFVPFLCMDCLVKVFGSKAATKMNILALAINLFCVGFLHLIASIQVGGTPETYAAFNATFTQTWQILLASSIAFLVSGIVNNVSNVAVGKLFRKNPNGKLAYFTRSYVSTTIGQFIDNFVFTGLAFLVFFNLSIGTTLGWTIWTVLGAAGFGALLELLMEVIFSPIGYKVCKKWQTEGVGKEYLDYCRSMEVYKESSRFEFSNTEEK